MKKLGYFIKKHWPAYVLALVCLFLYEAADMVSPQVAQRLVDDVIIGGNVNLLTMLLLTLLGVGVVRVISGYLKEFTFDTVSFRIATDIRKDLMRHIQKLGVDFFDKTNTGEIMSRVTNDVDQVQVAFGFIGMLAIQVVVHTALVLYFMFKINWKLALLPVVALPVCGVLAIVLEKKLDKVYDDISEQNAKMNTVAEENLAGVRVVKAFAREKFEIMKFLGHNKTFYDLNMKQSLLWVRYDPIFMMVTKMLPLTAILLGGIMVIRGNLSLGELTAFECYCENAIWPMEMLGWLSNEIAAAFASKKKLDKVYGEIASIQDAGENKTTEKADKSDKVEKTSETTDVEQAILPLLNDDKTAAFKSLEFDHVSLKIGDKEIIRDVSFTLNAGETLGVMGATGSGKTTLINLALRFYDPTEGTIRLNGTDIRELPLEEVRRVAATVMQDIFLFSDTIAENVKFGKKDSTSDEDIHVSLKAACADEFVDKLEEGIDTIIGERGVGLSGGQKQRISMARAFAKHAPVLILDDSTSALDMETEHQVQENLKGMGEMAKVIVAHRISAVRHANEIIVLEDGSVLEHGTHEELMQKGGYYYKTFEAQYGSQAG